MAESYVVIKCGGSTLSALPASFYRELKALQQLGITPIMVHGGGPAISKTLEKFRIPSQFINGLRKTTEEVLDVVEMVLSGSINKQIVRLMLQHELKAIGLSGVDGQLLSAEPVAHAADVGFVGDVIDVNVKLLQDIVKAGYVPVIAPLGIDATGQRYNINADTAAGAVASHLGVERLVVITDVPGIMSKEKQVLPQVSVTQIKAMIDSGEIYGGMIPKVEAAMQCLQGKVQQVIIVDGAEAHSLTQALNKQPIGTRIIKEG